MSVLPHLNAHLLLTEAENDEMQLRNVLEHDRIMKLVTILAKKGEDGFHRFLAALEKASDHLMHGTIAETLKQSLSRCKYYCIMVLLLYRYITCMYLHVSLCYNNNALLIAQCQDLLPRNLPHHLRFLSII